MATQASKRAARKAQAPKTDNKPEQADLKPADHTTEAFLREVDDALREERIMGFWKKYQYYIIGAVVFLFVAVGAQNMLNSRAEQARTEQATTWYNYKQNGDNALLVDLQHYGTPGYQALAHLAAARNAWEAGDTSMALDHYDAIIKNKSLPQDVRDLAQLNTAFIYMADSSTIAAARELLSQLIKAESMYEASAREQLANIYLNQGNVDNALTQLETLVTLNNVPKSLMDRANEQISLIRIAKGL